ncbi:PAS domain S-box protein [Natronococcus wangiae]|uniref:PAS domain S-box protein n=1 Tax=Natronococcus wangiae TaxID=3068275 RepID=UPI00273F1496|nr:PAS domain S-box protein [Natronococcus sp. AD5]
MNYRGEPTDETTRPDGTVAATRQWFQALVGAADGGVYQLDADETVVAVSDELLEITGYANEELLGEHVSELFVDGDGDRLEREIGTGLAVDADETLGVSLEAADGGVVDCSLRTQRVVDAGTYRGAVGVVRDRTERDRPEREPRERDQERELERERGLTDRLLSTSPIGILVLDANGDVARVNERARELLGCSGRELERYVGGNEPIYDEDGDRIAVGDNPFTRTLETGEPVYDRVLQVERSDGDRRWLSIDAASVRTDDGEIDRVVVTAKDVTELKRRERRLERRTDELSAELGEILGRVSDAVYALDEEWRFTYVNDRAAELLGRPADELLGEAVWDVFPAADSKLFERYREAMEAEEPVSFERYSEPLGIWAEVTAYPSETGLSVYFRDVTEQKERERRLAESEERYRTIAEHFPNGGVGMYDRELRYTLVSGTMWDEIDADPGELEGNTIYEAYPSDIAADIESVFQAALEGETGSTVTAFEGRTYRIWTAPLRDADGEITAGMSFALDITEQIERERRLEESERRYRALAEHFPNGIVTLFDHDLEYTLAAGKAFDRLPVEPADLEENRLRDAWGDDIADTFEPAYRTALEGEERAVEVEYAGREWLVRVVPITDDDGSISAGMTMVQDVTERKERERYLEDAKAQLEAATEAGAVGTWEWHVPEDRFVAGAAFAETFGVDPDAAREGVSLEQFVSSIHEADRERVEREIEDALESCGEYEEEYRVWNHDGELRWVVARGHVECDEEGNPETFPGALTDITERKRAEQELQRHKRQLETLFELLPVAVVVADADGRLVEANETAKEIWGGDIFDAETVADYGRYDGWWADTGAPVDPEEWTMARVLEGEEVTEPDVYEVETADGERRTIMVHGMPVTDARGEVRRGVITQTDVTERREYQHRLEETVEMLETTNERLEQFAYAASHDLQEPLRMVSSYLRLIEQRYGDELDEDGREFLEFAIDGADRMRNMIDGLLAYSRIETAGEPLGPIDLEAVLDDVLADLRVRIEESDAEITAESLPRVEGDGDQLRQLFQNLLSNAITYSEDGAPHVRVSAERRESKWAISVSDDGIGIEPNETDRIFEVFHRLHSREEYSGTGIGLALCQRIVERHGGDIWVDSEPGEGSTFSFTLPAADEA